MNWEEKKGKVDLSPLQDLRFGSSSWENACSTARLETCRVQDTQRTQALLGTLICKAWKHLMLRNRRLAGNIYYTNSKTEKSWFTKAFLKRRTHTTVWGIVEGICLFQPFCQLTGHHFQQDCQRSEEALPRAGNRCWSDEKGRNSGLYIVSRFLHPLLGEVEHMVLFLLKKSEASMSLPCPTTAWVPQFEHTHYFPSSENQIAWVLDHVWDEVYCHEHCPFHSLNIIK